MWDKRGQAGSERQNLSLAQQMELEDLGTLWSSQVFSSNNSIGNTNSSLLWGEYEVGSRML